MLTYPNPCQVGTEGAEATGGSASAGGLGSRPILEKAGFHRACHHGNQTSAAGLQWSQERQAPFLSRFQKPAGGAGQSSFLSLDGEGAGREEGNVPAHWAAVCLWMWHPTSCFCTIAHALFSHPVTPGPIPPTLSCHPRLTFYLLAFLSSGTQSVPSVPHPQDTWLT